MFLIIQTGDPVPPAYQQFGRFSDWFIQGLGINQQQAIITDVHLGQALPVVEQVVHKLQGIIITGSPAMVTEKDPWLLHTQRWLTEIMAYKIPILGVCFGHQLLADLLGGQVDYNPKGRNLGHSRLVFTEAAQTDPLLQTVSQQESISTFASHLQHVKTLPPSATLLGSCELDQNHAFRAEDFIWCLQFHPEWNAHITQAYIEARSDDLLDEGASPTEMVTQLKPSEQAYGLLAQFVRIGA